MALGIYTSESPSSALSSGDRTSPFNCSIDGYKGGSKTFLLYLRSDSDILAYSDITVTPYCVSGTNLISGSDYYWKLFSGETCPTSAEWAAISKSNSITFEDISSSAGYYPFWLQVTVPINSEIKSYTNVSLKISTTET